MMALGEREWVTIVRGDGRRYHWDTHCPELEQFPWSPPEAFPWPLPSESRRRPCCTCSGPLKARTAARRLSRAGGRLAATRRGVRDAGRSPA